MKNPSIQAAFASLLLPAICAHAATLSWDNGAATGNWNTADANWTGSTWNNGTPDSALFSNINGNVALTEAITADTLSFHGGGWQSGARQLALSGSTLSLGSISINGFANGGNVDSITDAYNQRLAINGMTINATGNVTVRRGMFYTYNGAVVNVSGGINSTDAWNVFRMDSGSVTATAGVDFSVIASQVEILGGTLTTPFIKVGNAAFAGTGGLSMSGGATVVATQNNSDFIQVYNNGDTGNRAAAWVGSGGLTLNTSTFNVTVATQLNGDGGLTKSGSGTLTLSSANTFTGGTTVNTGTLQLQANSGYGNLQGTLTVNSGATVVTTGDGTGLGWQPQRLGTLNINGGTVTSAGIMHVWSMGGGVNMQGGTLQSNNGVSTTSGSQLEWGNTQLNTSGNATATIAGRVNIRTDASTNFRANVADGTSATDLLVTAAFTQSSSSGVLAKLGGGTMEITSTGNSLGQISAAGGNLVLSGSSTFAADNVYIADSGVSGGGSGSLTIKDNATLTVAGNFMAGNWNNTVGAIYQSGGTVNLNGGGSSIRLGHWPNGGGQGGYYYLSGGTVNMPNTSMYVGWDGYGQMNISGGTFNAYGITSKTGSSWGDVIITAGTLNVGAGGLTGAPWYHLDGGTIRATVPFTINASTVLMNGTTIDTNGNDVLVTSSLQNGGSGGLVKAGAGTLTINTYVGYTGPTVINGGTVQMNGGHNNLWNSSSVTINSGGKLSNSTHSHILALTLNGGELASTSTDAFWGGWMLDQNVSVIGTGTSVISADRVAVANASNVSRVFTVAGTATLNVTGRFEDAASTTNNGMTKAGAGTMILAGNNAYTGPTTVSDGLLISQNGTGIPDLSTVVMANLATAALQITTSEQVGLLSGGGGSGGNISVATGATLTTGENGGSASYDGIISGTNASLKKRGGGTQTLTGINTFSGGVEIVSGTLAVPSITTAGVAQPLGMGTGPILFSGPGGLSVTGAGPHTSDRGLTLADNANTLSVAGELTLTGAITGGGSSGSLTKAGAGTFNQSGAGSWSGNVFIGQGTYNVTSTGSIGNAGVIQLTGGSTFNIDSATQVRASSIQIDAGTVNLNAGTLRTNGISMASGTTFNWNAGTLTMQTDAAGSTGVTDRRAPGSSLSAQPVYEGRIIDITGTAAAITVPNGGTLDLGPTYGSFGMRYDQLRIAGTLNLSTPGNTLNFEFNPLFFRPSSYGVDAAGTLILVDANGFSGTFESFTGVMSDYIGFNAAPGSGSVVGVLGVSTLNPLTDIPQNTYYLEYETDTGNVLFHYRLTATIPEPASAGLIVMGSALLRILRRRRKE